jgi:hypothetical protein
MVSDSPISVPFAVFLSQDNNRTDPTMTDKKLVALITGGENLPIALKLHFKPHPN